MNRHPSRHRRLPSVAYLWLPLLATMLMACGTVKSRSLPQSVTPDGRTVYGVLPLGPSDRERLTALPPGATYRWGLPSAHFSGTSPAEDTASTQLGAHDLRVATTDVLRLSGWREAAAGEVADFEIAVARYERSAEWFELEPDPRAMLPDPRSCQNQPPARRSTCVEPMARNYPPVKVLKRGTDTRVAVAIMRVSDRATAWWIAPQRVAIQREMVALLQVGARNASALNP